MLAGKNVVLGVCGGIAAFKAAALTSKLVQAQANVHVIMTQNAQKFVTPLTFQALSKQQVYVDTFEESMPSEISHIQLADRADLCIVAPATANFMAKLAYGLADDMLSTTMLATRAPIFVAPAMNGHMYENSIVQQNKNILANRGIYFIEPKEGQLACGYVGTGRLAEPDEIVQVVQSYFLDSKLLEGKKILVTAGGTVEKIDPVRYISNFSSGKMGYYLAEQAKFFGAEVTLITAPTNLAFPSAVKVIQVQSALDMHQAVMSQMNDKDIIIMAAAVADYRPVNQEIHKIKKNNSSSFLELIPNVDILLEIGEKKTNQFVVGFAAESQNLAQYAMDKVKKKKCDLLVANDITQAGAGFQVDTNQVDIFDQHGLVESLPTLHKQLVARKILQLISKKISKQ